MALLNENIPLQKLFIRNEFLFDQKKGHGEFTPCWLLGVKCQKSKALLFHALLANGALFTNVPIHAFTFDITSPKWDLNKNQMWDCLAYNFTVKEYGFLKFMPCEVFMIDNTWEKGVYLFSIDFFEDSTGSLAENPEQTKHIHIIKLNNGNLVGYPQNRLKFTDRAVTELPFPEKPEYEVNSITWICEKNGKEN